MLRRVMLGLEIGFFASFWLQTRINLRELWPDLFSAPLNSDYLIPFVYLSDILLLSLIVVWLTEKIFRIPVKSFNIHKILLTAKPTSRWLTSSFVWWGLFWLAATASIFANGGEWWSWYGWLRLSEGLLFAGYIFDRWQHVDIRKSAIYLLAVGLVLESVIMLGEWFSQRSLGWQWLGEWSFSVQTPGIAKVIINGQEFLRSYGTFAHPNIAASALLVGFVVLSWWILSNLRRDGLNRSWKLLNLRTDKLSVVTWFQTLINKHSRFWLLLIGILFSAGIFVTFSRSVWLVGLASIVLLLVWSGSNVFRLIHARSLAIIIIGTLAGVMLLSPIIWSRFNSLDNTDRLSIERRLHLNDVAVDLLQQRPGLGVGINNFIPHLASYGPLYGVGIWREPVHNLYLLIAVETGMIGIGLWLLAQSLVWIQIGARLWQGSIDSRLPLLLTLWVAVILLGLIDHYWWTSQQGRLMWWMLVGSSLATLRSIPSIKIKDSLV